MNIKTLNVIGFLICLFLSGSIEILFAHGEKNTTIKVNKDIEITQLKSDCTKLSLSAYYCLLFFVVDL